MDEAFALRNTCYELRPQSVRIVADTPDGPDWAGTALPAPPLPPAAGGATVYVLPIEVTLAPAARA
jgi:hypothetical protein